MSGGLFTDGDRHEPPYFVRREFIGLHAIL
jgi:hypothetical protein